MCSAVVNGRGIAAHAWWVAVVVCAGLSFSIWAYTVDDAYIVYRYARNLAQGHGAVFNPGERVEGYSSPLWLIPATLAEYAGLPPEQVAKTVSLVFILALIVYVSRTLRGLAPAAQLPLLLLATYGPLHVGIVCGLETAVNAAIVACLWLSSHATRATACATVSTGGSTPMPGEGSPGEIPGRLHSISLALWGSLALLCRPENGLLVGVQGLYLWCVRPAERRRLYTAAAAWLCVITTVTLVRLGYYAALLPNTAVAKISTDAAFQACGWFYCRTWLKQFGWLILLGLPAALRRNMRPLAINAWLLIAAQVSFVLLVGGDWMPQWRFLLPVAVLLTILGCHAVDAMAGAGQERANTFVASLSARRLMLSVGMVLFLAAVIADIRQFRRTRWSLADYQRQLDAFAAGPVRSLAETTSTDDLVVARDIGILGYNTRCRILDVVGLTDAHVARSSGYRHRECLDSDYVFALQPDYLMLQTGKEQAKPRPLDQIARTLIHDRRFAQYRLGGTWDLPGGHRCEVYRRVLGENANITPVSGAARDSADITAMTSDK
jgi:hypothetical protein